MFQNLALLRCRNILIDAVTNSAATRCSAGRDLSEVIFGKQRYKQAQLLIWIQIFGSLSFVNTTYIAWIDYSYNTRTRYNIFSFPEVTLKTNNKRKHKIQLATTLHSYTV